MTFQRYALGIVGENLAVDVLSSRGYAILERRYRTDHGEIDIIAMDGETLVFVEVRAKATAECGTAAESVTREKQRRIVRMAAVYLAMHNLVDPQCRFDVVAIDEALSEAPIVTVFRGAFDAWP
jgi:putative endonuclease